MPSRIGNARDRARASCNRESRVPRNRRAHTCAWFRGDHNFELIPRNVIKEAPVPFSFRGFEEAEVKARDAFPGD